MLAAPATPHQQVKIINLPYWEKSPTTAKSNKSFLPFLRLKEKNKKVHGWSANRTGEKTFLSVKKKKKTKSSDKEDIVSLKRTEWLA